MKKLSCFLAGVGCTLICTTLVVPALAAQFEATFNSINIQSDGRTVANAGESFSLADGSKVPYSILYNGTTYLPMRKVAEMVNKDVAYNNETRTANLVKKGEVVNNDTENIIGNFKKYTINGKECVKLTDIDNKWAGAYSRLISAKGNSSIYGLTGMSINYPDTRTAKYVDLLDIPLVFENNIIPSANYVDPLAYIETATLENVLKFIRQFETFDFDVNDTHVSLNPVKDPVYRITYDEFVASLRK